MELDIQLLKSGWVHTNESESSYENEEQSRNHTSSSQQLRAYSTKERNKWKIQVPLEVMKF